MIKRIIKTAVKHTTSRSKAAPIRAMPSDVKKEVSNEPGSNYTFKMTDIQRKQIRAHVQSTGQSMSMFVRDAIDQSLAKGR